MMVVGWLESKAKVIKGELKAGIESSMADFMAGWNEGNHASRNDIVWDLCHTLGFSSLPPPLFYVSWAKKIDAAEFLNKTMSIIF